MKRMIRGMALSVLATGAADAALLSRAGGQAYYDTALDITWVADALLARTSGYDSDGFMTWDQAQAWIGTLNTSNYLGVNTWRLPNIVDTGTPGCDFGYSGTDCGYNVDLSTGEMAHLYYSTLGNLAYYDTSGHGPQPGWGETKTGPFSNIRPLNYWSGTTYAPRPVDAWHFWFPDGYQDFQGKHHLADAWAVSPGDAVIPVPAVGWLVAGAFAGIGAVAKRGAGTR